MIDLARRGLAALNARYIYGKFPLLHAIILLIEVAIVARLATKFNTYYHDKPVLTIMMTNAVLGGVADTVAQALTALRIKSSRKSGFVQKDEFLSIEITDLDKDRKNPQLAHEMLPNSKSLPPPFDFERLTRFMAWGFIWSPVQFHWYGGLSRTFPMTKSSATLPALKRMACDQLIFAPVGLVAFFTFMTIAEGGGKRAISRKLQDTFFMALKANWLIWPAVQILNFRVLPVQFQIPFVSSIGIAWTAYLSLSNASED